MILHVISDCWVAQLGTCLTQLRVLTVGCHKALQEAECDWLIQPQALPSFKKIWCKHLVFDGVGRCFIITNTFLLVLVLGVHEGLKHEADLVIFTKLLLAFVKRCFRQGHWYVVCTHVLCQALSHICLGTSFATKQPLSLLIIHLRGVLPFGLFGRTRATVFELLRWVLKFAGIKHPERLILVDHHVLKVRTA